MDAAETASLEAKIDALTERVDLLLERQRALSELMEESGPILDAVMQAGMTTLGDWEQRGYFAFGRSLVGVIDRVATSYTADDVDQLGDAVVGILDTVRNVTQPDVLAMANEATDVLHHAEELEPVGVMTALRKSKDEDIQRGMAVALEMLRHVGKASAARERKTGLARHLAPRRKPRTSTPPRVRPAAPARPAPAPAVAAVPKASAAACSSLICIPGFDLDDDAFLVDPNAWTREFAETMAQSLGIALTADHWAVVDYMRATYAADGKSPNVRQIAKGSGVGTRAVYQLFDKAPGKTAARIAGVPKPVGCI
jgi:TusE/DsrC/DsvC family sulfur relay protein